MISVAEFPNKLLTSRKNAGLTQLELSRILDISMSEYSRAETAKSMLNIGFINRLARFYAINVSRFFEETKEEEHFTKWILANLKYKHNGQYLCTRFQLLQDYYKLSDTDIVANSQLLGTGLTLSRTSLFRLRNTYVEKPRVLTLWTLALSMGAPPSSMLMLEKF